MMNTGGDGGGGATAEPPAFECLLEKKGSWIKNWKTRFFVLERATLRYYGKRGDATPKGTFGVVTYVDLPDRGGRKRDNRVDILGAGGARLCLLDSKAFPRGAGLPFHVCWRSSTKAP